MESWGHYVRRVTSTIPTRRGARYPIRWTEQVVSEGWYFNDYVMIAVMPPITMKFYESNEAYTTAPRIERIQVPTYIKVTRTYEEHWIIVDAKTPPQCCGGQYL